MKMQHSFPLLSSSSREKSIKEDEDLPMLELPDSVPVQPSIITDSETSKQFPENDATESKHLLSESSQPQPSSSSETVHSKHKKKSRQERKGVENLRNAKAHLRPRAIP